MRARDSFHFVSFVARFWGREPRGLFGLGLRTSSSSYCCWLECCQHFGAAQHSRSGPPYVPARGVHSPFRYGVHSPHFTLRKWVGTAARLCSCPGVGAIVSLDSFCAATTPSQRPHMAVMTVYARDHEPCMFPHSRVSSPCPLGDSFRDACAARTGVLFFTSFPRRWLRASPLLHFVILHVIWSRRGRVLSTDPYSTPSEIGVDTRGGGMNCTTYEVGCTCAHRALAFLPPSPFVRWAVSASGKCALAPCVE
ncbi:hypothetical protein B0H16DRAFT_1028605 [Mycena metata]|uniref:Uncharacterized protein n=1 Tax=Mycena metata TaxID=1033252 RepID=A0AAD7N1T6_9AGAR|nr:hypothetical protein B0H16DRAFT_1028605 [Mycena metata]